MSEPKLKFNSLFRQRKYSVLVFKRVWLNDMGECGLIPFFPKYVKCRILCESLSAYWMSVLVRILPYQENKNVLSEINLESKNSGYLNNWFKKISYENITISIFLSAKVNFNPMFRWPEGVDNNKIEKRCSLGLGRLKGIQKI